MLLAGISMAGFINSLRPIDPFPPIDPPFREQIERAMLLFVMGENEPKIVKNYDYSDVNGDVMFVGDSRTVGMHNATGDAGAEWVCKVGATYSWLISESSVMLDGEEVMFCPQDAVNAFLSENPKGCIYFNLGVNDLGNQKKYCAYINALAENYPEAEINYVSVNPVEDDLIDQNGYFVHNEMIDSFNVYMRENVKTGWIECNDYMKETGFTTLDGLHYDANTYRMIFSFVTKESEGGDEANK